MAGRGRHATVPAWMTSSVDSYSQIISSSTADKVVEVKSQPSSTASSVANRPLADSSDTVHKEQVVPWEQHTRGIGSKILQKMGYKYGEGLGADGKGLSSPIKAPIVANGAGLSYKKDSSGIGLKQPPQAAGRGRAATTPVWKSRSSSFDVIPSLASSAPSGTNIYILVKYI